MGQLSYRSNSLQSDLGLRPANAPVDLTGFSRFLDLLLTWHQRRRSRANLAGMPDAMLKDIGMSRGEADQEWEKPFWRA